MAEEKGSNVRGRDATLAGMQLVMGELPGEERHVPAQVEVVEDVDCGAFTRRKLRFAAEPGDRCWAWLMIPTARLRADTEPGPGMLCLHQTTRIGKDEPAGLGGKANLHYARELAERGVTVLVPDYPGYGDYTVDAYALGYASATMKGIWNHMRALDVLTALPMVDPARTGCIGHSLGGHNALFLAAFDTRLRAVVSSCGFTRFTWNDHDGHGDRGDVTDWSHAGYMPRIVDRYGCRAANMPFDFPDVLAAIAPRGLFINAPTQDSFRWEGVEECVSLVQPLYESEGAGQGLVVCHPACAHDFPADIRAQAYAWLEARL